MKPRTQHHSQAGRTVANKPGVPLPTTCLKRGVKWRTARRTRISTHLLNLWSLLGNRWETPVKCAST